MAKQIAIIGAGALANEIASWFSLYDAVFFVSDAIWKEGGRTKKLSEFHAGKYDAVIGIGDPKIRRKLFDELPGVRFKTLIHSSAHVCTSADVMDGVVIMPEAVVSNNAYIGRHALINIGAIIGHDCYLTENVVVSPNAGLMGGVITGSNVQIGAGAIVRERLNIASDAVIGMGSVVLQDAKESGTYFGNPARLQVPPVASASTHDVQKGKR